MVGKRKRETAVVSRSTKTKEASLPPANDAQDIFRKYFEAQFEPIEQDAPSKRGAEESDSGDADHIEDDDDISESDSDWDGLDEESDEDNVVEIVEHKDASLGANDLMDKKARKAFMVGTYVSHFLFHKLIANTVECETAILRGREKEADQDNQKGRLGRRRPRRYELEARP